MSRRCTIALEEAECTIRGSGASPKCSVRTTFGAYVNFLGDEGAARIRDAYPGPTWGRLRAIKARHDSIDPFRLNQSIPSRPME